MREASGRQGRAGRRAIAAALVAFAALCWGAQPAAALEQEATATEVRVAAQLLADGRVEVALQTRSGEGAWSERLPLERRYLPADAEPGRWLWTAPRALDGAEWRATARRLASGAVEVALQVRSPRGAWSGRLLPERRFLPRDVEPGHWLSSSPVATAREQPQIIAFYGHPDVHAMGVLGHGTPAEVAVRVSAWAARYDALNGPRGAVGAYHLIVGVAQTWPTPEGDWLGHLEHERIAEYVEAAREHGLLLFLDTQIGWSDPLTEVRLLEPFLREPFVHVALDPEFATEHLGVAPGLAIGSITGEQVNDVQRYLAELVREGGLPPKILMVHQSRTGCSWTARPSRTTRKSTSPSTWTASGAPPSRSTATSAGRWPRPRSAPPSSSSSSRTRPSCRPKRCRPSTTRPTSSSTSSVQASPDGGCRSGA